MLVLEAPAKINWFLRVLGKREDKYHDIKSVMQCVTLYDTLIFERADSLEVECALDVPPHENIVYRAASLLKQRVSYRKGAKVSLKKNIPLGAGLGGGSSDAASALLGLNVLWELGLNNSELGDIGGEIGSDVPFFLGGPFALVEGKGERVEPLGKVSSTVLLLVKPEISVSTSWAYSALDLLGEEELTKNPVDIKLFCQALNEGDFASLGNMLCNDFEYVVMREYPDIKEIKRRLPEIGAATSAMSGSGSTVFGVFRSRSEAERAALKMKPNFCRVVETITTVSSKQ